MVKWRTVWIELGLLGAVGATLLAWHQAVTAPVTAPVTASDTTIQSNHAAPVLADPVADPVADPEPVIPRHRRVFRHRRRASSDPWCKQLPRIAYSFDRATIIRLASERGYTSEQINRALACLGK